MMMKIIGLFLLVIAAVTAAGDWHWIDHSDIFQPHGLPIHNLNFTFQILDWYGDGRKAMVLNQGDEFELYIWDALERKWDFRRDILAGQPKPSFYSGGIFESNINPQYFIIADYDNDCDWDFIFNELWIYENTNDNENPRYKLIDPHFNVPSISDNYGVYNFSYHPFFLDYDGDGILDMIAKTRRGDAALCIGDADFNFSYAADVTAGALPRLQDYNADGILDVVSWVQGPRGVGVGVLHSLLYFIQSDNDLPFEIDNHSISESPTLDSFNLNFVSYFQLIDFDEDGDLDLFFTTNDRHIRYMPNDLIQSTFSDTLDEKWGHFNGEKYARPVFRNIPNAEFGEFTFIQQADFAVSSGGSFYGNADFEQNWDNALQLPPVDEFLNRWRNFDNGTSPDHNDSFKHNLTISYQDVNNDNVQDMIRSFQYLEGNLYISDNWQGTPYANDLYLNQGTEESPDWIYEPTLLQKFNNPDTLYLNLVVKDIDGDGSLDALLKRNNIFTFYTNAGTFEQPDWRESRKLYSGLPLLSDSYPAQRYLYHCTFVDLDHDNIDDLVFGTTFGGLYAFKNMQQDSLQWQFWPYAIHVFVDSCSVPAFSDVDRDGDMDLFIGDKKGFLYFYENASTVHVEDNTPEVPADFYCTNFPNPFNSSTTISFHLPNTAFVNIEIYDITGRRIQSLNDSQFPPGQHQFTWNGMDEHGLNCATGIYFFRIHIRTMDGEQQKVLKASLIR